MRFAEPVISASIQPHSGTSAQSPSNEVHANSPTYVGEYVIDKVVDDGYAEEGDLLHRIRWYGFSEGDDTWKPCHDIPRSHLLRYYRRIDKILPWEIRFAQPG